MLRDAIAQVVTIAVNQIADCPAGRGLSQLVAYGFDVWVTLEYPVLRGRLSLLSKNTNLCSLS